MPDKSKDPFQFWEELKRRRVIRVIPVYAAAAFVLLELVDIISEPFGLPDWTLKLVTVLLVIGFIISVILSWIYDVTPEGIEKTKPSAEINHIEPIPASKGWKIATFISVLIIIAFVVFYIVGNNKKSYDISKLEKSIAVLPFINESSDEENTYFINGMMESILDNLSKIEDLQVRGRTSVEQYRNNLKPIPTVAKEMKVSYVLEGSGQKVGNRILLSVQLIIGKDDDHIWSHQYDRRIEKAEDIFDIQKEIAQLAAKEIEAIITPEEKQLMEKVPTTSLMANELYQRGRDEYIRFLLDVNDKEALTSAQKYYLNALEYDSTYAKACAGMALTFYSRLAFRGKWLMIYSKSYLEENAFDTVFFWANRALHIDKQLPEAYYIRGICYYETGNREKAEQDYQQAIQLNPNYWEAFYGLGNLYFGIDYIKVFEYNRKAATLARGPELSYMFIVIIQTYLYSGLFDQVESIVRDYVSLTQDSLVYYFANFWGSVVNSNPENQHSWITRCYAYDSTNPIVLSFLAESYINLGNYEEGMKYYKQSLAIENALGRISVNRLHRVGYAFSMAGYKEEADYYFDRAEEIYKCMIRLNRPYAQNGNSQLDLALIYAFRGEKSKAMEILRDLYQRSTTPYVAAWYMQWDPMLDSIRDDPEFQQIANDLGLRLQDGTEILRQWLEENDML